MMISRCRLCVFASQTYKTYTFSLSIETLFSLASRSLGRSLSLDRERFLTPLAGDREDPRVRVSAMLTITACLGNQAGGQVLEGSTSCKHAQTGSQRFSFAVRQVEDSVAQKLNRGRKGKLWGGAGRGKNAVRKAIIFCFDLGPAFVRLYLFILCEPQNRKTKNRHLPACSCSCQQQTGMSGTRLQLYLMSRSVPRERWGRGGGRLLQGIVGGGSAARSFKS